ncbi:MAG: PAC2 family protein [Acidimicrobiales bacterium]|nr:PAC2 family protein [Acidimicrobiales bacterium]
MTSEFLRWNAEPDLRSPVLVCAFEGWNDAGEAATTAARFLADRGSAPVVASIDAEEFYDFTTVRPRVELDHRQRRSLIWPANDFRATSINGHDFVILTGYEPQLKWRTFSSVIIDLARQIDARLVVTLGALLTDVPHSRPVPVYGSTDNTTLAGELDLEMSSYEGPTGIVGALQTQCHTVGLPTASLWAAVPSYVSGAQSPKAALAILDKLQQLLAVSIPTTDLEIATADYERQISQLVEEDEDTADFVAQLEAAHDEAEQLTGNPEELIAEVERFLRDR